MTELSWLSDLLAYALPGGFLGAAASWAVGRRKRNNDFLAEMQRSIDLLSEKYNQVLQENVALRREKADWQVLQQELVVKVDKLTREIENLRRKIKLKNEIYEKRTFSPQHAGALSAVAGGGGRVVRGDAQPDAAHAAACRNDGAGAAGARPPERPQRDGATQREPDGGRA